MSVPSDLITASQRPPVVVDVHVVRLPHRVRVFLHVSPSLPPCRLSLRLAVSLSVGLCTSAGPRSVQVRLLPR